MEYRLYFFVPYNISDIQKGIQAGHAALEYANLYYQYLDYIDFVNNNKTWIILNGGTTNSSIENTGTLDQIQTDLFNNGIRYAHFYEPDLNNALTAVCFLADERVWDKEKYPDYISGEDAVIIPNEDYRPKTLKEWEEWGRRF